MSNQENRIKKPQRFILALTLALSPLLLANSVMAQTQAEYNAEVSAAEARISSAQEALRLAQEAYNASVMAKAEADSAVNSSRVVLDSAISAKAEREQALASANAALQKAQSDYNTLLISDPSWIRPKVEETYFVEVPYAVQVPYTVQETVTEEVARVVQVPHTETVTKTTLVPREVTTVTPAGLTAKSYNMQGYNSAPPFPTEDRLVATITVPDINFQWGGGQVLNSGLYEDVIVNFTGTINIPQTGTYTFYSPADDGTKLYIDGNLIINDWVDKGGGGTMVQTHLSEGPHSLTLWYYENGGGANVGLYWITPGGPFVLVPASAFGETTQTTTVYDEVTITEEVTTYTEETVYDTVIKTIDVIKYSEEVAHRREERTRLVPDMSASAPLINDPALLQPIAATRALVSTAQANLSAATQSVSSAQSAYDSSISAQNEKASIIELASTDVTTKQQELNVAQQELEAIPPFREPTPTPSETQEPTPEPTEDVVDKTPNTDETTTPEAQSESELRVEEAVAEIATLSEIAPEEMSDKQIEQLVEAANQVFETAEQGSPQYEQALEALATAADADDPELPAELAAIPGAAVALEVLNNLGNVGADMSPQVRKEAEQTVIASVIATGAAVQASVGAATAAATTASTTSGSSSGGGGAASGGSSGGRTNRKVN